MDYDKPDAKPGSHKAKTKKKTKKKKCDGPTCSMFLAELTKKLASKRREKQQMSIDERPDNIIHSIISSLTNALPIVFFKTSRDQPTPPPVEPKPSLPNLVSDEHSEEMVFPPKDEVSVAEIENTYMGQTSQKNKDPFYKVPRMPLVNSDVLKVPEKKKAVMMDSSVNTGNDRDVATELAQHVGTLRKISLIAEEFNQKTAKNLKEIVDSVQIDLLKKLEEIQAEQKAAEENNKELNQISQSLIQQV